MPLHCKSASVPTEMYVGYVFGKEESDVRPVQEWDMKIPDLIAALCNKYETGQIALCALFLETVKKASCLNTTIYKVKSVISINYTATTMVCLVSWLSKTVTFFPIVLTLTVPFFPIDISTDRPLITSRKLHPSNGSVY